MPNRAFWRSIVVVLSTLVCLDGGVVAQGPVIVDLRQPTQPAGVSILEIVPDDANDRFGDAIAYGDIDGDNLLDLVIGAPGADSESLFNIESGELYVIYGKASYSSKQSVNLDTNGAVTHGETRIIVTNEQAKAGERIVCADFNADGYDDIAFSASGWAREGSMNDGAVLVLFGSPGLRSQKVTLTIGDITTPSNQIQFTGQRALGNDLAATDFDFDGHDDLVIGNRGAWRNDPQDRPGEGMVVIAYGADMMPGTAAELLPNTTTPQSGYTYILGDSGVEQGLGGFGEAVATGADFNGDGYDDIGVAAPFFKPANDTPFNMGGAMFVLYWKPQWRGAVVDLLEEMIIPASRAVLPLEDAGARLFTAETEIPGFGNFLPRIDSVSRKGGLTMAYPDPGSPYGSLCITGIGEQNEVGIFSFGAVIDGEAFVQAFPGPGDPFVDYDMNAIISSSDHSFFAGTVPDTSTRIRLQRYGTNRQLFTGQAGDLGYLATGSVTPAEGVSSLNIGSGGDIDSEPSFNFAIKAAPASDYRTQFPAAVAPWVLTGLEDIALGTPRAEGNWLVSRVIYDPCDGSMRQEDPCDTEGEAAGRRRVGTDSVLDFLEEESFTNSVMGVTFGRPADGDWVEIGVERGDGEPEAPPLLNDTAGEDTGIRFSIDTGMGMISEPWEVEGLLLPPEDGPALEEGRVRAHIRCLPDGEWVNLPNEYLMLNGGGFGFAFELEIPPSYLDDCDGPPIRFELGFSTGEPFGGGGFSRRDLVDALDGKIPPRPEFDVNGDGVFDSADVESYTEMNDF